MRYLLTTRFGLRAAAVLGTALVAFACGLLICPGLVVAQDESSTAEEADTSADRGSSELSTVQELNLGGLWQDNEWWAWLVLLGAIFVGVAAGRVVSAILRGIGSRLEARGWEVRSHVFSDMGSPASVAVFTVALMTGMAGIKMGSALDTFFVKVYLLLFSIAVLWYAYNLVSIIELFLKRVTARTRSTLDDQVVPLIRKTVRVFLVVMGALFILDSVFQQDIGAWLAGLGIAGLAISLAAQDSLKNLFGSITILFDQPFQIGDRINYKGYDGIVKEIGFRSTKVQTLTGHLVTIPNSNIVNDPVENIGVRKSIRRILNVTITYDTPPEKIRAAIDILRGILEEPDLREPIHQTIDGDEFPPKVFFNDYNPESLNLFVIYWFAPPAYWDYLEHAQKLNLRIFEEFSRAGIDFAFPTQTIYLAGDQRRELAVRMLGADLRQPPG